MPIGYGALNDHFWIDLCYNFGLALLAIVSVSVALLMLCCCQCVLSLLLARSQRGRQPRGLRRSVRETSERGFTTNL